MSWYATCSTCHAFHLRCFCLMEIIHADACVTPRRHTMPLSMWCHSTCSNIVQVLHLAGAETDDRGRGLSCKGYGWGMSTSSKPKVIRSLPKHSSQGLRLTGRQDALKGIASPMCRSSADKSMDLIILEHIWKLCRLSGIEDRSESSHKASSLHHHQVSLRRHCVICIICVVCVVCIVSVPPEHVQSGIDQEPARLPDGQARRQEDEGGDLADCTDRGDCPLSGHLEGAPSTPQNDTRFRLNCCVDLLEPQV